MGKFRALGLMDREGEDCFNVSEPAWEDPTNAMGSFFLEEGNPKARGSSFAREPEGDPDIPIHEAEGVVISNDHHRTPEVPAIVRRDQSFAVEAFRDEVIERINPKGPLSDSGENLEGPMGFE